MLILSKSELNNLSLFEIFLIVQKLVEKSKILTNITHRPSHSRYASIGHSAYAWQCVVVMFLCIFHIWNYGCSVVERSVTQSLLF